jgi:flagellar protein FliJ
MKKFRFPLQTVRDLRDAQEQTAQGAYREAVRVCEHAITLLAVIDDDLRRAWQILRDTPSMCVDDLRKYRGWCGVLDETRQQRAAELECAQRNVTDAHAQLVLATRRREVMDRLFQKQRRVHERNVIVEAQKFLDEIATRRAWRPELEAV